MKEKNIISYTLNPHKAPKLSPKAKKNLRRKSEEEVLQAALHDEDALPFSEAELEAAELFIDIKHLRKRLHLTQKEFSHRFKLPLTTVRDWEQYRAQPDSAARVLLTVIDRDPEAVSRALRR